MALIMFVNYENAGRPIIFDEDKPPTDESGESDPGFEVSYKDMLSCCDEGLGDLFKVDIVRQRPEIRRAILDGEGDDLEVVDWELIS